MDLVPNLCLTTLTLCPDAMPLFSLFSGAAGAIHSRAQTMQRAACDRHNSRLPGCEGWAHATGAEHQAPAEQYHRHAASQGTPAMQRTSSCLVGVTGVEGSIVSVPGLRQRRNGLWHANVFDPGTQRTVILGDFATQQQVRCMDACGR